MVLTVAALVVAGIGAGALFDLYPSELIYQRAQRGYFEIWQQTLAAIAERPWLGHGSMAQIEFEMSFDPGSSPPKLILANKYFGSLPATLMLCDPLLPPMCDRQSGVWRKR